VLAPSLSSASSRHRQSTDTYQAYQNALHLLPPTDFQIVAGRSMSCLHHKLTRAEGHPSFGMKKVDRFREASFLIQSRWNWYVLDAVRREGVVDDYDLPAGEVSLDDLTWREQEVLALLAERLTNREIGDRLHLTENTVKTYVGKILGKLYVKNRRQAVERAKELGLLDPERKTFSRLPHSLPVEPTPFIGRAEQLAEISRVLAKTRLLTLTGTGGIGKTRLALQAASNALDEFENGVFFVSLAPISSGKHIVQTAAEAIGFPLSTEEEPIDQLLAYLRRRQLLLLMDNFEHLLDSVDVVSAILKDAPGVKILATSREKLNLQGETTLSVTTMDFPAGESIGDPLDYEAIQLFLQGIRRRQPEFEPLDSDLVLLAEICQLVEGMPLAIELAAAWTKVLSLENISNEIQKGLDILTTEMRDVPERHRSIRAVFDHSWSLMEQAEREVFARLSVFRGGLTLEAAQQVAGASLPSLARLANKSFLHHAPRSGRYEMHELLRGYARERLEETPEISLSAHEAHAAYFASFAQGRREHLKDSRQGVALSGIEVDIENVRTAWRYWLNQANAPMMRMFLNSFWLVYWVRGWNHAADELFGEAVKTLRAERGNEDAESVKALSQAHQGYFKTWMGFADQGYELAKEGVAILEGLDRPVELALALGSLNVSADFLTLFVESEKAARKMQDVAVELEDKWLQAFALYKVSVANEIHRDREESRRFALTSLELFEELGESIISNFTLLTLGHKAVALGEHRQAKEFYLRCLQASETVGYRWATENSCKYLGQMALALNETEEAEAYLLRSLRIADEIGMGRDIANLLYDLAEVRVAEDQLERAVELLALILVLPASHLHRLGGGRIRDSAQGLLAKVEAELSSAAYAAAWERGNGLGLDEVLIELLADL
jgi:predicted ATPase/DNA-binding CsgD family transcriptional regulator